jgi:hypothetical protein
MIGFFQIAMRLGHVRLLLVQFGRCIGHEIVVR